MKRSFSSWTVAIVCLYISSYHLVEIDCRRNDKCTTKDGQQGVCVKRKICRFTNNHTKTSNEDDVICCPIPASNSDEKDINYSSSCDRDSESKNPRLPLDDDDQDSARRETRRQYSNNDRQTTRPDGRREVRRTDSRHDVNSRHDERRDDEYDDKNERGRERVSTNKDRDGGHRDRDGRNDNRGSEQHNRRDDRNDDRDNKQHNIRDSRNDGRIERINDNISPTRRDENVRTRPEEFNKERDRTRSDRDDVPSRTRIEDRPMTEVRLTSDSNRRPNIEYDGNRKPSDELLRAHDRENPFDEEHRMEKPKENHRSSKDDDRESYNKKNRPRTPIHDREESREISRSRPNSETEGRHNRQRPPGSSSRDDQDDKRVSFAEKGLLSISNDNRNNRNINDREHPRDYDDDRRNGRPDQEKSLSGSSNERSRHDREHFNSESNVKFDHEYERDRTSRREYTLNNTRSGRPEERVRPQNNRKDGRYDDGSPEFDERRIDYADDYSRSDNKRWTYDDPMRRPPSDRRDDSERKRTVNRPQDRDVEFNRDRKVSTSHYSSRDETETHRYPNPSRRLEDGRGASRERHREISGESKTTRPRPKVPGCGVKPFDLFIAGGEESEAHEWPWMTAIFRRPYGSKPKTFICGGSLINTKFVLTAAHCFVSNSKILPASSFVVRLGSHQLSSGEEYTVSDVIVHSNHTGFDYFNDIALAKLASSVPVTYKIAPVCLPFMNMMTEDFVNEVATVAGWGEVTYRSGNSRVLQHVSVPVVSAEDCSSAYSRIRGAAFLARGSDHVICAGLEEGGKDACLGDSGGPLMLKATEDRWTVIGIVSLGFKCAEPGYPGVYTRVTHYMNWIWQHINETK